MILIPYFLLCIIFVVFCLDAKKGILAILLFRPILDCFWEAQYIAFGIKPTEITGAILPCLVFLSILMSRDKNFIDAPLSHLWLFSLYYHLLNVAIILTDGKGVWEAANFFFRTFNGFVGYYAIQEYFRNRDDFKHLLLVLICAGIFPIGMSVYQNFLGGQLRVQATYEGLVRSSGLYHDALTYRLYGLQTIIACLLYGSYFLKKKYLVIQGILYTMIILSSVTIYKTFSKAAYLTGASWIVIWNVANKNIILIFAILMVAVAGIGTGYIDVHKMVQKVFVAEIDVIEGDLAMERSLTGRWSGWTHALKAWAESPIHRKLIGMGESGTGMHNDFLRALTATGLLGLLLYCTILVSMGVLIAKRLLYKRTALGTAALMIYLMWWVDSIGLVPGAYPGYQWFALGFIGLALRGVDDLETAS